MQFRAGLVISILAISLAGCMEEADYVGLDGADTGGGGGNQTADPGSGDDPASNTDNGTTHGNGTSDGNITNTPPVANLTADVLSGEAPLSVTFTIEGSDAEGDDLSWTLFIDGSELGNGSTLPDSLTHAFEEVGVFVVQLVMGDGSASTAADVTIEVTEPAAVGPEPIVVKGTLLLPASPSAVGLFCVAVIIEDGIDGNSHTFAQDVTGWSYAVENSMTASFWVYWYNADFELLGNGATGTVPAGYATAEVCVDLAVPNSEYTLTITPP